MGPLKNSVGFLLKTMKYFDIPVRVTEHYSKAFGKTVPELDEILN